MRSTCCRPSGSATSGAWWPDEPKPSLKDASRRNAAAIAASDASLGDYFLHCEGHPLLLFTENETNNERLFGTANPTPYVKDGINDCVVADRQSAVNPNNTGTKAAAHYQLRVGARATAVIRLRLSNAAPGAEEPFGTRFAQILEARRREADEFYRAITPAGVGEDAANVMRQALAGMLWSKQFFFFDVDKWLQEHGVDPMRPPTRQVRNREWFHMISDHVISMPDKWEYPWFAAWDLAFHTIALATVDVDFAKQQLDLLLVGLYLHPTGQIPAYEWNFSDVNPPVHGWATIFLYRTEQALRGKTDLEFLTRMFGKLTANFGWWVNRKDRVGRNLLRRRVSRARQYRRLRPQRAIADRRLIWSRPMAPRGWPSCRRTCSRSPSNSRRTSRPMKSWRRMSRPSSC